MHFCFVYYDVFLFSLSSKLDLKVENIESFSSAVFLIVGHSFSIACTCYLILIISVYFISEIITAYTSIQK